VGDAWATTYNRHRSAAAERFGWGVERGNLAANPAALIGADGAQAQRGRAASGPSVATSSPRCGPWTVSPDRSVIACVTSLRTIRAVPHRHPQEKNVNNPQSGTRIHRMNAVDLVGRYVANQHGAEFRVRSLELDAASGRIVIELADLDEDGEPIPGTEVGVERLNGWEVL
jgi:hypothetical protein